MTLLLCISMGMGTVVAPVHADVDRIREKAMELEQGLNTQRFETEVKGKESDFEKVYKHFAFLLKDSKIQEAAEAGDQRLAMFLRECKGNLELSGYFDDLHNKQQSETVEFQGVEKTRAALFNLLGRTADAATRRKIYSSLKDSFELDGIFRNQIVTRQIELAQEAGDADYASAYAMREQVDLDKIAGEAKAFISESQAWYGELLEAVAQERLGVPARKVKFLDFPYLLRPTGDASIDDGMKTLAANLGVPDLYSHAVIDNRDRPGRAAQADCYALSIPDEVVVGITPTGTLKDLYGGLYALGTSGLFSLSTQSTFEDAYLLPQVSSTTLGYLVRTAGELGLSHVDDGFLSFYRLLEARVLAAQAIYEIALYRGDAAADEIFKTIMREAYGCRLASSDVKRRYEFATSLESVGRFEGLMTAHALVRKLEADLGEAWYLDGRMGKTLASWYASGGTLTPDRFLSGGATDPAVLLAGIQAVAKRNGISKER